jgi:serine/threonine-protein kinase
MPYAPDLAGSALDGRYELHGLIGEGTFGRVYRGYDRRLERTVAVKVIKPWWADDPHWAHSFEREARLLARVSDPGIVQIYDVGQADEGIYYVAEFVDGESLARRLRRGALPASEAREIAEQLSRALGHAHAQRVVHRDVKPANVLLSAHGEVKIGDFGVARLAEGSTDGASPTIVGTPKYMAPEQSRGLPTTPATDVYSVGVVLYEMLTGEPPFRGGTGVELALRHLQDPPPPLPAGTPRALAAVVDRALAKDPGARYRSGLELADALAAAKSSAEPGRSRAPRNRRMPAPSGPVRPGAGNGSRRPRDVDPTRVAPRMTKRRNVNPPARRRAALAIGSVLTLVVAMLALARVLSPPARVRVPQLHGLGESAARARVRHGKLRPVFASTHDSARRGTAISQRPAAGARVSEGSTVRIVLSLGPPPVPVPKLVGQTASSAQSKLHSLGLRAALSVVPAPGTQPGIVTSQTPRAGKSVPAHGRVALDVAETPSWHEVTSFSGSDSGSSVPFRIQGSQWRVMYRMSYAGTCTFIFICNGPSAQVQQLRGGSASAGFDLNEGDHQTRTFQSGPGVYQVSITPGSDNAQWSVEIDDYY